MMRFPYTFVCIKLKLFVGTQLFVGSFAQKKCLNFYNGNYYAQAHRTLIPFLGLIVLDFGLVVLYLYESQDSLWFFLDGSLLGSSVLVSLFRISYPDLVLTKPKARSGQIRFVRLIACQECDRRRKNACSNKSSKKLRHIYSKTLSQFS